MKTMCELSSRKDGIEVEGFEGGGGHHLDGEALMDKFVVLMQWSY